MILHDLCMSALHRAHDNLICMIILYMINLKALPAQLPVQVGINEKRGQDTGGHCADVTTSPSPSGAWGKAVIAPHRRLSCPRIPGTNRPSSRAERHEKESPAPTRVTQALRRRQNCNPSRLAEGLEGGFATLASTARTPAVP